MDQETLTSLLYKRMDLIDRGITFVGKSSQDLFLSYRDLYNRSLAVLAGLQDRGVKTGDELVLQTEDNQSFIILFWACILGGIVAVPLTIGSTDEQKQKLFKVWKFLKTPCWVTSNENFTLIKDFASLNSLAKPFGRMAANYIAVDELFSGTKNGDIFWPREDAIALVQFSSGSTGDPKGVTLTHKNILSNVRAISNKAGYSPSDTMLSWMPLTHDMGLIGFHINPLWCGINHYIISTGLFIRKPAIWLEKASQYRITILCSPNFGYRYLLKYMDRNHNYSWDLSAVRIIYNGAEPISMDLCTDFTNALQLYRLSPHALRPVYGLAEASLAVSISEPGAKIIALHLDRSSLKTGDQIVPAENERAVTFVNVGNQIDDCSVRITDNTGKTLEAGYVGNVQIKGANVTGHYYNNQKATRELRTREGWLRTGDLGFTHAGALYITGRVKDIIWINGQNYYAHDIERVAEGVEGIELNQIVVCGRLCSQTQKDEILAFVLYRGDLKSFIPLAKALKRYVNTYAGVEINHVLPVRNIPKTTSGKLQRFKLLALYENGYFKETELHIKELLCSRHRNQNPKGKPQTADEKRLLDIWEKLLDTEEIEIDQRFFEIGGNSLKVAEMSMLILKEFGLELPPGLLYEKQTIRQLCAEFPAMEKQHYLPVPIAPVQATYPLSSAQLRLYFAWEIDKKSVAYNLPTAFEFRGTVDPDKLYSCLAQLAERHDTLRMCFQNDESPRFRVYPFEGISMPCSSCNSEELNDTLKNMVKPFDLTDGPLYRFELLKISEDRHILFMDFHHIISDGMSICNFLNELWLLYNDSRLPAPAIQYKDYTCWEKQQIAGAQFAQARYWQKKIGDKVPLLNLPLDDERPLMFKTNGEKLQFELTDDVTLKLRQLASRLECTIHVLFSAVYGILLSKYTGEEDLLWGMPVSGRAHYDLQALQGMFVNNLAIRTSIIPEDHFLTLITRLKEVMKEAMTYQAYPFENLVNQLAQKRDMSRNPVFDTMFIFQNMDLPTMKNEDLEVCPFFFSPGFSKYDLSLEIFDAKGPITYYLEYATALFKPSTILNFQRHFEQLLLEVIENSDRKISELSVFSVTEFEKLIRAFNHTERSYPRHKTIHQLFEDQVAEAPEAIAAECCGVLLTYQDLNSSAEWVRTLLERAGIKKGSIIGVFIDRSPDLIAAILGVLKAGCTFMALDTGLPKARLKYMLEHSNCIAVVSDLARQPLLEELAGELDIHTVLMHGPDGAMPTGPLPVRKVLPDVAYIIYTSGTTGNPKAVMIKHLSLINYTLWASRHYVRGEQADFPLFTSIAFDLTLSSIFIPLLTGNRVVVYPEAPGTHVVENVIRENKVDVVKLTPSHLKMLLNNGLLDAASKSRIRRFIVGGELLESKTAKAIHDKFGGKIQVFNEYGPTEATVGCMIHLFDPKSQTKGVPIGIPADNTRIYILDRSLNPVPPGVNGELYISGDGLAPGYLFNERLTASKFIVNPFVEGSTMYKTGDIARHLADGVIEYLGRSDRQVKIKGYRMELSEIEYQLNTKSDISAAVVAVKTNIRNQKFLCAYYCGAFIEDDELRSYLATRLPHYMIPAFWIRLTEMPLTGNGKTDYDALPAPAVKKSQQKRNNTVSSLQGVLLKTFREVFENKKLTADDNFFELGGDSITSIQIASALMRQGISLNARDILTYQTIRELCRRADMPAVNGSYDQAKMEGSRELSPIENWFFAQHFKNPDFYNQSVLLKLNASLDIGLLNKAFTALIRHHDGLRQNFDAANHRMFYNSCHWEREFVTEKHMTSGSAKSVETICQGIKIGFDIKNSLLIRAAVIQDVESDLLFITMHHLVTDGISWRILLEDLYNVYGSLSSNNTFQFAPKTASPDLWRKSISADLGEEEYDYWHKTSQLKFRLPQDVMTEDWSAGHMRTISKAMDKEKTALLLSAPQAIYNTTVPVLLNTAVALGLKDWLGNNEIIIEQESHGRHLKGTDVSRTIGWFTAIYPLRLLLNSNDPIDRQVLSVKEQMKNIPLYGDGYGLFDSHFHVKPLRSELRLNYLGQFGRELDNSLFTLDHRHTGQDTDPDNHVTAKIEINCMVVRDEFVWNLAYHSLAFTPASAEALQYHIFNQLELILKFLAAPGEVKPTASDFGDVLLSEEDLKQLFS